MEFSKDELKMIEEGLSLLNKKMLRKSKQMVCLYINEEVEDVLYNFQKKCFCLENLLARIRKEKGE